MFRVPATGLVLLILVSAAWGSQMHSWARDDIIENPRSCSANGRFCVVVREYAGVPDFGGVRADKLIDFDDADYVSPPPAPPAETIAFYSGGRLTMLMTLPAARLIGVADSGRFVIEGHELFSIYDSEGSRVAALSPADILTPADLQSIEFHRFKLEASIRGEEMVIPVAASVKTSATEEIRIRLADGSVVTPRRDVCPQPRVWASPADFVPPLRSGQGGNAACFTALANDPEIARVSSRQLFARATARPLPDYPLIAQKVRISGRAWAEVIVSESGDVICSRINGLPFGIDQAVEGAIRRWKFEPYVSDGKAMKMTSEIEFHFDVLGGAEWEKIQSAE